MFNTEDSNELKSMYKGIDELTELFHRTDSRVIKSTLMDAIHTFIIRMTNIKAEMGRNIDQLNEYAHSKLVSMMDDVYTKARTVDKTDKSIKSDIPNDSELDADTYNKALAFLGHNLDHNSKEYIDIVNMLKTVDKTDKNIKPDEDSKDDTKHIDDKEDKESVSTSTDDSDATIEKFLSMIDDAYNMLRTLNETYEDSKDDSKHTDDKKAGKFDKNIEEVIRSLDKYLGSMMDMKKNNDEKSDN